MAPPDSKESGGVLTGVTGQAPGQHCRDGLLAPGASAGTVRGQAEVGVGGEQAPRTR